MYGRDCFLPFPHEGISGSPRKVLTSPNSLQRFARDLNTMHEESNCKIPLFLSNQSCGVHLIAELLWRGEVMQGVRRRERVVMVEICMVVEGLVLQPVRSRLVRQVRGRIYSWRGQRLLVWRQEPAQLGSQWKRSSNGIKLWSFKLDLSSVT